jgi:hypothetical protein
MSTDSDIAKRIRLWLKGERTYQLKKWGTEADDLRTVGKTKSLGDMRDWDTKINEYIHRAQVLGYENPAGRQALAKGLATMAGWTESVVRLYGDLPEAGVPSGENIEVSL